MKCKFLKSLNLRKHDSGSINLEFLIFEIKVKITPIKARSYTKKN